MPRRRVIDDIPTRFCPQCGKPISKQKPGGKWKTPTQYQNQKACSVKCSRKLRDKTKKAREEAKAKGEVVVKLSSMDLWLTGKSQKPKRQKSVRSAVR